MTIISAIQPLIQFIRGKKLSYIMMVEMMMMMKMMRKMEMAPELKH
jgi:hypothetical protein